MLYKYIYTRYNHIYLDSKYINKSSELNCIDKICINSGKTQIEFSRYGKDEKDISRNISRDIKNIGDRLYDR